MAMRFIAGLLGFAAAVLAAAAPLQLDTTPAALAQAMRGHRVVLLGEVHDNAAQHALRVAALRQLLATGARPAIAFEQFDRERQPAIDGARRDADHLIAQARGGSDWHWEFYREFVALALEYDLPIVAANLSRTDAMRVAIDGWPAVFDAQTARELKLDALPAELLRKQEGAIAIGHCDLLSPEELPSLARAQMARDIVMARSIGPHLERGVVLLAGNGHVRRDIGVPFWLPAETKRSAISIGILERDDDDSKGESGADFDAYVVTERAERPDPCKELAKRRRTPAGGGR